MVVQATMYLPVPGTEPLSSVFLGECVTRLATVVDAFLFISSVSKIFFAES